MEKKAGGEERKGERGDRIEHPPYFKNISM
jgi:hypothetical protein